jgi:hypothetical protein
MTKTDLARSAWLIGEAAQSQPKVIRTIVTSTNWTKNSDNVPGGRMGIQKLELMTI